LSSSARTGDLMRRPDNPLFGLNSVVITPHAAYFSEEAIATVNTGELVEARWSRSS
jgi:phosphoglycerate dehydrogenase-like enzyme